jgi:hypothetical protein
MTTSVKIKNGSYLNKPVRDVTFSLVKDFTVGAKSNYVTVRDTDDYFGTGDRKVRVKVDSIADIEITGKTTETKTSQTKVETDEEVMNRIEQRFDILQDMTKATISGDVRAMIVVGPPGVGKSYGVEYELEKSGMFDKIAGRRIKYEVIKGAMTAIGLYCTLYRYSDPNNVLVFDDCDSILMDDLSLNILKAALDSGKKRRIYWNSDSAMLRREGVPDQFDFKGSVIFITNINFDNVKSKRLQDHLGALQSRCHYLDLTLDTMRDKILRIKQIFRKGDLFVDYDFTPEQGDEIINFMSDNKDKLREVSLRMALKIADLTKVSQNWKVLAESTCMRHG